MRSTTSLPLHEGLIVTTDGPEVAVIWTEHSTDNMLGVTTERPWFASHAAWVSEDGNETVVISTGKESTVGTSANTVDVSAISALGVDSLNVPSELDS